MERMKRKNKVSMINGLTIIMVAMAVAVASPVVAQTCPPPSPLPPALPTNLEVNLLRVDGSNIDTTLFLRIDYTDIDGCPQSMNSVDDAGDGTGGTVFWGIYSGKSNLYTSVPAKGGTDITITVEGYEPFNITAVENGDVIGDYYLPLYRTDEFNIVMDAAIAANGQGPPGRIPAHNAKGTGLYDVLNDGNDSTTPLVLDVRSYSEYAAGHIPGAINIYYRELGKQGALDYLDAELAAHIASGKKNQTVVYANTNHIPMMVASYLKTQGYAVKSLKFGFAEWTQNETVAPGRFKECTSFDPVTGEGTGPAGCNTNNYPFTSSNPINVSDGTHGGQGYPPVDCIPGSATSSDLPAILRCVYDARFGDLSKPDYRMTAQELYHLLDDNLDGVIQGTGDDLSNDPYVLSNRGTKWNPPTCNSPGIYYTGHIPSAAAVEWCRGNDRQELRALNRSDFLPQDKLIVHHCWVGVSQQYGGFWYNMLNYTTVSLDFGMNSWTTDSTVRESTINPANWYKNNYAFDTLPQDTTPPPDVTTTVVQRLDYKFNITWTPVTDSGTGVKMYRIYQRLNNDPGTDTLVDVVFGSSPSQPYVAGPGYDDGNLYQYKVTAVDNAGNEGNGTYTPAPPVPPIPFAPLGTLLVLGSGLAAYAYNRRKGVN